MKKRLAWIGIAAAGFLGLFLIVGWLLPAEYRLEAETEVSRTPDRAWRRWVQLEDWPDRFSPIQSVQKLSDQEGVGTRWKIETALPGGLDLISEVEVTHWVEGQLYAHRHVRDLINGRPLPVVNAESRLEFRPAGDERTRVIYTGTFEAHGPLKRWYAWLVVKPMADKAIKTLLAGFNISP
jgi:uncharacterized membrane protein